jgi:putative phosphoribosyl transferase
MAEINAEVFSEQRKAGYLLGEKLVEYKNENTVIVSTSWKSSAIAFFLAEKLSVLWAVVCCEEIIHPANSSKTIGSVSLDEIVIHDDFTVPSDFIQRQIQLLHHKIKLHSTFFTTITGSQNLKYKHVIIVCDYLQNCDKILAAVKSIKKQNPLKTIVASIAVEPEPIRLIASMVDRVVFLKMNTSSTEEKKQSESFDDVKPLYLLLNKN